MPTVYLIPCPIGEDALETIPAYVKDIALRLKHFYVENERSARRYLKALDKSIIIDELELLPMNKQQPPDIDKAKALLKAGKDIGIISEAGCPAIADPGNLVVMAAHEVNAKVKPLVGPNSMLLALIASGMNGQRFAFHGYLPIQKNERVQAIKKLEQESKQLQQTQLFMETPYRNNQLLEQLIQHCQPYTLLCIAADITSENEFIKTASIKDWKKNLPDIHKRPAVFLLYCK